MLQLSQQTVHSFYLVDSSLTLLTAGTLMLSIQHVPSRQASSSLHVTEVEDDNYLHVAVRRI